MLSREILIVSSLLMSVVLGLYFAFFRIDPMDLTRISVNQKVITERHIQSKMELLRAGGNQVSREQAINALVDERLLEFEAQKTGQTSDHLMDFLSWIDRLKIPKDFRDYYRLQDPVRKYTDAELRQLWKDRARRAFLDQLKSQAAIVDRQIR